MRRWPRTMRLRVRRCSTRCLGAIETPLERARLARGVIARREGRKLEDQLAATALIDLASGSRQLLCAGLLEAVAVRVGAARTPAGIVLAA